MAMPVELRRPLRYNKPSYPNLYHRVILIQDIETTLERVGGDDLVERFKQGPFGHFLGWSPGSSYSQVLHGILCRAIHSDRGILFVIRGRVVEYTLQDHALITGLCFGSTTFDPTLGYDPSQSSLYQTVCGDQPKTAKQLWDMFMEDPSPFDDDDGEIHLQLAKLLVANIFILGHDDGKRPFSWMWQLTDDTQAFNSFPWGAYSYMTLLHYVTHAKDTKRYHFYGPAWALIVWGLEVVGGLSDMAGLVYDYDLCPRCLRWHFARQAQATTDRQFYAMLDDATLPIHRILPTDFEQQLEYYRTSLLPNALDVYFNVPVSASDDLPRAPRRRQPVHEPEADTVHVDGSRPRRSTQRRVVLEEDFAEPSGSGSRQSGRGRDLGKRVWEPSSSRSRGLDRPEHVTRDDVRQIVREELNVVAKRVEDRVMNRITKYYEDLKALFSCRSRRSSPVHEPRRRSPPIVSSARASGFASFAGTSGLDARDPTFGHVEDVGGRRDTTLPLYTVAPTDPSTELGGFESFAHEACSSIFGQLQSSTIPPFGQQYHPSYSDAPTQPHRYSMPEMSGTTFQFPIPGSTLPLSSAPFVTTRDPPRSSASAVEVGQDYLSLPTVLCIDSERVIIISKELKMYLVESKGGAIACMLLALLFLGTWPALLTLLERRGRLPQHTYLDYTITNLLAAVIIAFTFGEIGSQRPNFLDQLSQDNWSSVMFAMGGGIVLSLGNLATQYAWAFVGLSVTEVISSSITVVIGTTLNYFLDGKINKAEILFPGVACFLIAVCFGSGVHSSNAADNKAKLAIYSNDSKNAPVNKDAYDSKQTYANKDLENGSDTKDKAKYGTANFLIELENKRAIKVFGKGTFIGLGITFFAGICFSLFTPAFNLATNDQWHTLKDGVPHLTVYTAFFYFSASCFVLAVILNISFLYRPVLNAPKSSFKAYLCDWNGRGWALLAGLLCGFGNGLQFMGGQAAGYAAADAVQALPLVSTFWGILLFGEYRRSSRRTYVLLVGMLSMFIVAVAVLMASAGHRK